jgi:translocation protein SEC63
VKELQGLSRVLDTLVYAYEFIQLPTPSEQAEGLEALRRTVLRLQPDLKVPACSLI